MKTIILLACMALMACAQSPATSAKLQAQPAEASASAPETEHAPVKPGIEVLRDQGFKPLKGKRVGLITNPTGIDNSLRSTIDILASAPDVKLTALFAPEHGVRGDHIAGAQVTDGRDPATGVPVYSLHGKTLKPTAPMLKDVDVLIYDIQDIGCRSYTFISTMGLAMEAAAEQGKEFMVLDRPNPLGGVKVEGCVVEPGFSSFVSKYPIPYLYGLTPGELAQLLGGEGMLKNSIRPILTVVPMKGWTRSMTFAETGMPWVLPSPHIPYPNSAVMYPATGIMGELNYVNIGVGYTLPFRLAGAPWIDAQKLADALKALDIPGVEWRPMYYKPFYAIFKDQTLGGVEIYVTDVDAAPLSLIQFYIMQELARLYPEHRAFSAASPARLKMFDKVCGSGNVRTLFGKNYRVDDMKAYWDKDVENFRETSRKYYLYE